MCREEWLEYQKERQRLAEERRLAREKREEDREALEQQQRERRETATARLASHGLSMLNIARHFLKERDQEERAEMRNKPASTEQTARLPRFKHWLGKRNPSLANLWRFRKRIAPGVEVRKRKFPKTGTLTSPYAAYREMVKKRFPEKMDESRLDATIALYMRCAGYTQQEVANELYRHTPARSHEQSRDEWIEYGRRVIGYAFGTAGEIDIANVQPTQEQIEKIVEEVRQITQKEQIRSTCRLR